MDSEGTSQKRVSLDGKFFRLGPKKFFVKGVAYGPITPGPNGELFHSPEQALSDFALARKLGANVLRIYAVPPRWFLDLALENGFRLLIDIPWNKHLCFLDSPQAQQDARDAVRSAVQACLGHPAVFAYSVVNEIAPDIVRWSGAGAIESFLEGLVNVAKEMDPDCLCTFASYPPTEFLRPENIDFICFNVYLHQQKPFENYLARLQMLADFKPLVIGEFGIDSLREGEEQKCEILKWQIEACFRSGLAGTVLFSLTDDWHKNGRQVEEWGMGITTRDRQPKKSFEVVQQQFALAPYFSLPQTPKVSVVVASYNGDRTLRACLESLERLNYPNYEIILVDDGSIDTTAQLTAPYKTVRYFRQPHLGLSVARNVGIGAATGEIVAFTDSDCRADEDWLYYLVGHLLNSNFVGIGGHNFLPPEDSFVAAAVQVSPGGPAHVMLNDRLAEHIPGCNMAFYKWALLEIGGFDAIYQRAGDDVDICWRLQQHGYKIGFSPAGFVWHYRRSTIPGYLNQQLGYGEAEALLVRRHPEYFNSIGGSLWQGRIYTPSKFGITVNRPIIYHGIFATGFFQSLYRAEPASALMLCTTLEYHVLVSLPLLVLSVPLRQMLPIGLASVVFSIAVCLAAGFQSDLPKNRKRFWSRPLVALLYFLQPICRGWARYQGRLSLRPNPQADYQSLESIELKDKGARIDHVEYWAESWMDRLDFLRSILARLEEQGWQFKTDTGWSEFDVEIFGNRWTNLQLATVTEPHPGDKQMFRCRLRTTWSLPGKVVFWSALGFELLIIGFVGTTLHWLWLLLLVQPLFIWFFKREQRELQRIIAVLLDEVAKRRGLMKIGKKESENSVSH